MRAKEKNTKIGATRILLAFVVMIALLVGLFFLSVNLGSLPISPSQMIRGLFFEFDPDVATVYDVRFPRIIIALIGGMALAISGTMLQAVMKNPLTDPGIIGISSAAALVGVIVTGLFPSLYFSIPLISILGGLIAYLLIYSLAWDGGVIPTRLILVGVALNMTFMGIAQGLAAMGGAGMSVTQSIVDGNIVQKTWSDVRLLAVYVGIGIFLAMFTARTCNLLSLDDQTARGLGVNVNRDRFLVALIAILLASVTTSIVGIIGFLGLLVPHIGRMIVGSNHKVLLPFSGLFGAWLLLLSDTVGRTIAYPYEVPAAVIMAMVGGPFFILLLKLGGKNYGN
ncbi:MAG: iron ABC transporter permease [Peptostreptococcaceae bacterium]|nr:iron ABC transporter permease [Peptostreptococcaceae bacterium]